MRKQIISIAVAIAFATPTLASADVAIQSIEEDKVLVSYDLKAVASEKGRAELERQVRRAAGRVCGPRNLREAGSLTAMRHNRSCFRAAVAKAMETVSASTGAIAAVSSN